MHIRSVLSFVLSCNYAAPQQKKSIEMNKYDEEVFSHSLAALAFLRFSFLTENFPEMPEQSIRIPSKVAVEHPLDLSAVRWA